MLALPVVLLVAGLAGWLLLADEAPPPPTTPSGAPTAASGQGSTPATTPPSRLTPGAKGEGLLDRPAATGRDPGATVSGGAASPADVVVTGRVIDPDGRAIPGAEVIAGGLRGEELGPVIAVADGAGRFTLDALPPTGLIEVVAARFARRVVALDPGAGPLEVVLAPARTIEGQVLAVESDRPLEGALIEGESASWRNRARSGADGRFRFDDAPDEEATLVVTLAGRKGAVVEARAATTVHLSLGRPIRGVIVDPSGAPVPHAMVFVVGADQLGHPHPALADEGGRFELTGIGDDEGFAVLAFAFVDGEELGTPLDLSWIEPGMGDEVTTRLERTRVVEVHGAPSDGALLALVPLSCPPGVPAGTPRAGRRDGAALRFEGVIPGAWQLERGGRAVGPIVDVPVGDPSLPIRVDLPPEAARAVGPAGPRVGPVRVRVTDETGRPVQGATVVVSSGVGGGSQQVRQSGPDGLIELLEPPPGVLVVSASVPGRVLVTPVTLDDASPPGEVRLTLARPVALQGRVRMPAPGAAFVTLHGPDGAVLRALEVQPDGRFEVTGLPPGPLMLEVVGDGCAPLELQVELPLTGELVIPLEPMGELHEHHEGDGHDHHGHEGGKG